MNGIDRDNGWFPLGVLTWNVRIGLGFTWATWDWVLHNLPRLHVVFLQEVRDFGRVQEIMGDAWIVFPLHRIEKGGCVVAVRAGRFNVLRRTHQAITSAKHQRHIVALAVEDKRTKRHGLFGSLHVDPLGEGFVHADARARRRHIRQVREWARFVGSWFRLVPDGIVVVGGDVNEQMGAEENVAKLLPKHVDDTAMAQLRDAGLRPAHIERKQKGAVKFDDAFAGGRGIKAVQRLQFKIPHNVQGAEHLDHRLVFVQYAVKRLEP